MKRIVECLLEEGILEEDIHRILDLIEEEYDIINELLPANRENIEAVNHARRRQRDVMASISAEANAKATKAREDLERAEAKVKKNGSDENVQALKNAKETANKAIKQQVFMANELDFAGRRKARNKELTKSWNRRHGEDVYAGLDDTISPKDRKSIKGNSPFGTREMDNTVQKEKARLTVNRKALEECVQLVEGWLTELKKETVDKVRNIRKSQRDMALDNQTNLVAREINNKRKYRKVRGKSNDDSLEKFDDYNNSKQNTDLNADTLPITNNKYRRNLELSTRWYAKRGHYSDAQNAKDELESTANPEVLKKPHPKMKEFLRKKFTYPQGDDTVSPSGVTRAHNYEWNKTKREWRKEK